MKQRGDILLRLAITILLLLLLLLLRFLVTQQPSTSLLLEEPVLTMSSPRPPVGGMPAGERRNTCTS